MSHRSATASIVAELTAAHPGLTPSQAVAARVDALRRRLEEGGLVPPAPPCDPFAYAEALGIGVRPLDHADLPCDAVLVPLPDGGFQIGVKTRGVPPTRCRFSVAHELVHTLLPMASARARYRLRQGGVLDDREEERLVDHGAACLLMPPALFRADLLDLGLAPESVRELAEAYGVSLEAAAVHAVQHWRSPAAVAFCHFAFRPRTADAPLGQESKQWRVRRAFHGDGFPIHLYPGYRFQPGSPVERAAVAGCRVEDETILRRRRAEPLVVRMAAMPLSRPRLEPVTVLAMMWLPGYDPEGHRDMAWVSGSR